MSDVSSPDLVGGRGGHAGARTGLWAEGPLFLYYNNNTITFPLRQYDLVLHTKQAAVPIFACRSIFITLTHSTIAAPELSMQFSIVW
jgi:hypothetical protein